MSGREAPGRYPRTYGGLLASLLVLVVVVLVYVGARSLIREQPDNQPEPVDYLETVVSLRDAGVSVVHPRSLPEGWIASSVTYKRGERPEWRIGILTDEGRFVGLHQQDADVEDLVDIYVDENAEAGESVTLDSEVAITWKTWSDEGGDLAYSTEVPASTGSGDSDVLLVYGSASDEEQEALIASLVR